MSEHPPPPIGPHDLGGHDAEAIDRAEHDVAHWEREVDAMINLLRRVGVMKDTSQLRDGIERLGPDAYEQLSYYERWAASAAHCVIESGIVSADELEARIAELRAAQKDPQ